MIIFPGIIVAFFAVSLLIGYFISAPKYRGPVSDHFDGKRFMNPTRIEGKGFLEAMQWMIARKRGPWNRGKEFRFGEKPLDHVEDGIRITFVNHSTFLIQLDGLNI